MELSRRDALRAGGGLLAGISTAGCIQERVTNERTRVESGGVWAISPETAGASLDREAFESYVGRMESKYGDSGVWGLDAEAADAFEVAYVQRLAITRETPGDPGGTETSLDPEDVDPEAPLLVTNACVAAYRPGDGRRRYWLWTATDATEGRLVRDVRVSELGVTLRLREGVLTDAAEPSVDGEAASVGLGSPPSGTFPLRDGSLGSTRITGENGIYGVTWDGELDGVQSINGVCEEEATGEYSFFWETSLGYSYEETV
jgi:hypothetical protein